MDRPGRRTRLREDHRAAVWDLYADYQQRLIDRRLMDFNDLLAAACREVTRCPVDPPYQAVVVDEVNDLNLLGLRLVRALAGRDAEGLLLVGDGRQAVCPGGARLRDAGSDVTGRRPCCESTTATPSRSSPVPIYSCLRCAVAIRTIRVSLTR